MVDSVGSAGNLPLGPIDPRRESARIESAPGAAGASFEDVLRDSIQNVDKLQHDASEAVQSLEIGEAESYAEVMTAVEKADIAFNMLMEVRNKLVSAYEELLRIRI